MTEDHTLVAIAFKFGESPEPGLIPDIFITAYSLHEIDVQALDVQAGDRCFVQ